MSDAATSNANTQFALTSNWLDYSDETSAADVTCWTPMTNYWWSGPQRILLKLSDAMYLRKLARRDKRLRKILEQFTAHIELTLDFDE